MASGDQYLNVEAVKNSVKGGRGIDVVADPQYLWTMNKSKEARKLAPRIKCKFYQQTKGQIVEAGNRWFDSGVKPNLVETLEVQKARRSPISRIGSAIKTGVEASFDS